MKYLALLRGINVGGKNLLPMKELVEMFLEAGCRDVGTYIQSGNVLFTATAAVAARLPDGMSQRIRERFDFPVPVVIRSAAQIADIVRKNPFVREGVAENTLHVFFLADTPSLHLVKGLDPLRSRPDEFVVSGQEIYLRLPNGVARTKLSNRYFDGKLATVSTGRNWRTVTKLHRLLGSDQKSGD